MSGKIKTAAIAVFTAIIGFGVSSSRAATVIQNGSTVGGWIITIPSGVSLVLESQTSSAISIEKDAAFENDELLPITFTQAPGFGTNGATAVPTIDIVNESVLNGTNTNWTGFQYLISNVSSPSMGAGEVTFAPPPGGIFVPPVGGGVDYTSDSFDPSGTSVTYNGTQPAGTDALWGTGTDGDLVINANPSAPGTFVQDFVFKEIPLTGPLVPLPAGAWQSLAGLAALGLLASGKRLVKRTA